jgi:hypothetical protein
VQPRRATSPIGRLTFIGEIFRTSAVSSIVRQPGRRFLKINNYLKIKVIIRSPPSVKIKSAALSAAPEKKLFRLTDDLWNNVENSKLRKMSLWGASRLGE